jgi:tetratricopeptide (TPR) repeat protein
VAKKSKKGQNKGRKPAPRKPRAKVSPLHGGELLEMPPIFRSVMEDVFGSAAAVGSPAERKADSLVEQACHASPPQRAKLSEAALKANPNCVDAHLLLGHDSESIDQAIEYYRRGVEAGERALKRDWQLYEGHFWGVLETRPYMRARHELAKCLWAARRCDEAIAHYEGMLRLNPNDNQGVRQPLLAAYLELGKNTDAEELIKRYDESASAFWAYAKLLLSFRTEGDSANTHKLLNKAKKVNKFVPKYLLGEKMLPREMPQYMGFGDENEAVDCTVSLLPAWRNTPGVTSWLRDAVGGGNRRRRKLEEFSEPPLADLADAPPADTVPIVPGERWQMDARQLPEWVHEDGHKFRPWLTIVHSTTRELIMATGISRELPTGAMACELVQRAIIAPMVTEPARPEIVELSRADWQSALNAQCMPLQIRVAVRDDLKDIDQLIEGFTDFRDDSEFPIKALTDISGMSSDRLAAFFEAASAYYRQQPWQRIAGDTVIRVDAPALSQKPWYASVMGQSGIEQGLALYDNWSELATILTDESRDLKKVNNLSAFSLMFSESLQISPHDLAAQEKHGWEIAGPEAYPCVLRVKPGMQLTAPTLKEMTMLHACLEAVPIFLNDNTKAKQTVDVVGQPFELTLSVVDEG